MAQKVFRFREAEPGIDLLQLRSEINDPLATIDGLAGGGFIDITADEAAEFDVIDALSNKGFVFVEAVPTSLRRDAFGIFNPNAFVPQVFDAEVVVPAGLSMVVDDPELELTGSVELDLGSSLVVL